MMWTAIAILAAIVVVLVIEQKRLRRVQKNMTETIIVLTLDIQMDAVRELPKGPSRDLIWEGINVMLELLSKHDPAVSERITKALQPIKLQQSSE